MWKASIPFPLGYTGHAGCVVTRTRFVNYRPADSTRTKTTLPKQCLGSTVRRKLVCQKGLIMPQNKCKEKSVIPPGGFLAPSSELTGRRKQGGGCDVEHHCCKPGCSASSAGERRGENTRGGDNYSRRGHSRETAAPSAPAARSGTSRIPAVPGAGSPGPLVPSGPRSGTPRPPGIPRFPSALHPGSGFPGVPLLPSPLLPLEWEPLFPSSPGPAVTEELTRRRNLAGPRRSSLTPCLCWADASVCFYLTSVLIKKKKKKMYQKKKKKKALRPLVHYVRGKHHVC